ncbi:hypothetical protein E2C01_003062 [Portunus trituberculatus]|uniref:Uncharacterized protein n=1 Tax=Portunus trituberculatus TaxID=210409 RepID=A0A5B7CQ05_PORTR|nr:hypothetical protein [Portunus trituberculatus]
MHIKEEKLVYLQDNNHSFDHRGGPMDDVDVGRREALPQERDNTIYGPKITNQCESALHKPGSDRVDSVPMLGKSSDTHRCGVTRKQCGKRKEYRNLQGHIISLSKLFKRSCTDYVSSHACHCGPSWSTQPWSYYV